jgi:hypothetical protein
MEIAKRVNDAVDRWLTSPEPNAAGRLGIFRILFALLYLWIIQPLTYHQIPDIPWQDWKPVDALRWLPAFPPALFFDIVHVALIVGLLLLLIGFKTRLATLVVFGAGLTLDLFSQSFGKIGHGTAILQFYIPFFMIFSQWGSTYSVDALLRRKQGTAVSHTDSSWHYGWPIRVLLLLLCLLYFTAGYLKLMGSWSQVPEVVANLVTSVTLGDVMAGREPNALALLIAQTPALHQLLRVMAITFELVFPLALLNQRWRAFFIASALVFHAFNSMFINVDFPAQLSIYLLFIDWQALANWIKPVPVLEGLPKPALVGFGLLLPLVGAYLWFQTPLFANLLRAIPVEYLMYGSGLIGLIWLIKVVVGSLIDAPSKVMKRLKKASEPDVELSGISSD